MPNRSFLILAAALSSAACKPLLPCGQDGGAACACTPEHELCSTDSECCAGPCTQNSCCEPVNAPCFLATDGGRSTPCCSDQDSAGRGGTLLCGTPGGAKGVPGICCVGSGAACEASNQCCSQTCVFGSCE